MSLVFPEQTGATQTVPGLPLIRVIVALDFRFSSNFPFYPFPATPREMRLIAGALLASVAFGLHPAPTRPPPLRVDQRGARRYVGRGGSAPAEARVGVFPCNSSGPLQQTFILDAKSGAVTLPDGQCLLRTGDDNVQSAGPCTGAGADGEWTLSPCTAKGCNPATQSWLVSAVDGKVLGLPGAVGPWTDVWTVDNPTGTLFNELWAFNASDSTVRSLCSCPSSPGVLGGCLSVVPPPPPPPPCTATPRVRCHVGKWDAPPTNTPSVRCAGGVGGGAKEVAPHPPPAGGRRRRAPPGQRRPGRSVWG